MIHAKTGNLTEPDEIEHQRVDRCEYLRILHADCGQIVDVKKTAIINFVGGHAPEAQAICLLPEKALQPIKAPRIALFPVDLDKNVRKGALKGGTRIE